MRFCKHLSIERHRLRSSSHVQKAVRPLNAWGVTEGGEIVDPVLALWLRRLPGSRPIEDF
ncbi:MAG: hypothetical protein A3K67_00405 [Euryarchaeota archaeon RBG_16_62_10]|nr:MAG: hypothetical protein A3K67_00405 [Euryarchaeota archaeon RBG_16_62_10]